MDSIQQPFLAKALLVSVVVGIVCALLSCFMVLKGWSLLGDAISHAVLPGVVIAYMIGIPFGVGALVFALLAVVIIGFIKANSKIKEDAAMGIVFTTLFSLGLILSSRVTSSVNLMHVLFGEILGISDQAAWYTVIVLAIVAAIILLFRRTFVAFIFDQTHIQSLGLPTTFIHYTLLTLLAVTIVSSLQTVGIILVTAMLITPGSTAFLITKRFVPMLGIAVLTSIFSAVMGVWLSVVYDVSVGGAIVFLQGYLFLAVFFYQTWWGVEKEKVEKVAGGLEKRKEVGW